MFTAPTIRSRRSRSRSRFRSRTKTPGHEEFLHEVRVATKLQHPNILSVLNASYIDDHFVIAMELGEESLADRIERRTSTASKLDLARQGLAALAHAHEHRIIHCDIKPENFILFPGNQTQARGLRVRQTLSAHAESVGVGNDRLHCARAGDGPAKVSVRRVFDGPGAVPLVLRQVAGMAVRMADAGSTTNSRRGFDPRLIEILRKAIQLDPTKRYRNAVQMQAEFERLAKPRAQAETAAQPKVDRRGIVLAANAVAGVSATSSRVLDTRHQCRRCEGPVSESMQACPWCGFDNPARGSESRMPAHCPRCERGVKNDWDYCAWCYGPGFVEETTRRYPDKRYTAKCANAALPRTADAVHALLPVVPHQGAETLEAQGQQASCKACNWGIAHEFWNYCAWCREPVRRE